MRVYLYGNKNLLSSVVAQEIVCGLQINTKDSL